MGISLYCEDKFKIVRSHTYEIDDIKKGRVVAQVSCGSPRRAHLVELRRPAPGVCCAVIKGLTARLISTVFYEKLGVLQLCFCLRFVVASRFSLTNNCSPFSYKHIIEKTNIVVLLRFFLQRTE